MSRSVVSACVPLACPLPLGGVRLEAAIRHRVLAAAELTEVRAVVGERLRRCDPAQLFDGFVDPVDGTPRLDADGAPLSAADFLTKIAPASGAWVSSLVAGTCSTEARLYTKALEIVCCWLWPEAVALRAKAERTETSAAGFDADPQFGCTLAASAATSPPPTRSPWSPAPPDCACPSRARRPPTDSSRPPARVTCSADSGRRRRAPHAGTRHQGGSSAHLAIVVVVMVAAAACWAAAFGAWALQVYRRYGGTVRHAFVWGAAVGPVGVAVVATRPQAARLRQLVTSRAAPGILPTALPGQPRPALSPAPRRVLTAPPAGPAGTDPCGPGR
ncbi:MAG: hypothetical protein ACXV3F_17040 [Frankiaceae bacterium]